jgi:hypothetical protein
MYVCSVGLLYFSMVIVAFLIKCELTLGLCISKCSIFYTYNLLINIHALTVEIEKKIEHN